MAQNIKKKKEERVMSNSYHTDHLGSSSWITNRFGIAIQHLQYLPFGEPWQDQRYSSWAAPYTFSGKERDEETGYSYFGARYYDSDLSIWLSVDPLASKYPSHSPYVYCMNNPIRLVDPNGMEVIITGSAADEAVSQLQTKNLKITRDAETGVLSYEGKAKTRTEKQMTAAMDSKDVTVNITAENTDQVQGISGATHNGGAFLGTTYTEDANGKGHVSTQQQVNPQELAKMDKDIGTNGMFMRHELTESYEAGLISLQDKASSPRAGQPGSVYNNAHKQASFAYDLIKNTINYSIPVFDRGFYNPLNTRNLSISKYQIHPKYNIQ